MRSVLGIFLVAFAVCPGPQSVDPDIRVPLGDTFVLRVDQIAVVSGTALRVRFAGVPEDSRCPSDVVCVWAGNARVRLAVTGGPAGGSTVEVNTGIDPRSASVAGYDIILEGVVPPTSSGASIPPSDYLAHLRVTPSQ